MIQSSWKTTLTLVATYAFITFALARGFWYESVQQQNRDNKTTLIQFETQLQSQLDRFSYIPRLLSKDRELIDALNAPLNSAQLDVTNRYLENVNRIIGAADTYLLDSNGTTIASSNWTLPKTFVGRNFAFRPYFQQAIAGNTGQYFALGSTSDKRGYYYAYPIEYAAESIGVIVVKMDLSHIENEWITKGATYLVTDDDSVVFMSSREQWLFHSLAPLSDKVRERIRDERRYLDLSIPSLDFENLSDSEQGRITHKRSAIRADTYLYANLRLTNHQLRVWVISSYQSLLWGLLRFLFLLQLIYALVAVAWLFNRYRRRKLKQLELIQAQSQQKLEYEVMARTAKLQVEIKDRITAESQLRQTQQELIQAAKLALLGKLSASISHELNNPLAAMRSFAENGVKFIQRGDHDRAEQNLDKIVSLTERMAKISLQLRDFARQSDSSEKQCVSPVKIIELALELTRPEALRYSVSIEWDNRLTNDCKVELNPVALEQVLVNLLTNAIQAASSSEHKQVLLSAKAQANSVALSISDSGPGVASELKQQLFEPFVTSKSQGLGLGLSISKELVEQMQGELTLDENQQQLSGATFVLKLPFAIKPGNKQQSISSPAVKDTP